jgi:hypothetical protein
MFIRIFGLFALAFALFGTQTRAATSTCLGVVPESGGPSCTITFSSGGSGVNIGVYDFTGTGDGKLVVSFDTVLDMFNLTVTVNHTIDPTDTTVFPQGTVCVVYATNGSQCDQYDFTGNTSNPVHGLPIKNVDYQHLITLTLSYLTFQTARTPAFGHAPGDITTFTEDILTSYSSDPPPPTNIGLTLTPVDSSDGDPTMGGKTPGLSSVVALDEPVGSGSICNITLNPSGGTYSAALVHDIEVTFQLFSNSDCTGTSLRDRTARISVSTTDTNGNTIFPPLVDKEEANKFHWDNTAGVNEYDLSTLGLPPGTYTLTIFSSNAPSNHTSFVLTP